MRTARSNAGRLAGIGAALTLALGGLAACGDDELPEQEPAPGVGQEPEEDVEEDPGVGGPPDPEEPEEPDD